MKDRKVALSAKKQGGVSQMMAMAVTKLEDKRSTLVDHHQQYRHTNLTTIWFMRKTGILPPIEERQDLTDNICQTCLKGKMTTTAIPKLSNTKLRKSGELVHTNLCGPMRTGSIQGNFYIITYFDDKTG